MSAPAPESAQDPSRRLRLRLQLQLAVVVLISASLIVERWQGWIDRLTALYFAVAMMGAALALTLWLVGFNAREALRRWRGLFVADAAIVEDAAQDFVRAFVKDVQGDFTIEALPTDRLSPDERRRFQAAEQEFASVGFRSMGHIGQRNRSEGLEVSGEMRFSVFGAGDGKITGAALISRSTGPQFESETLAGVVLNTFASTFGEPATQAFRIEVLQPHTSIQQLLVRHRERIALVGGELRTFATLEDIIESQRRQRRAQVEERLAAGPASWITSVGKGVLSRFAPWWMPRRFLTAYDDALVARLSDWDPVSHRLRERVQGSAAATGAV